MILISRNDAKKTGLTKYFTGKPCRNGHIAERYVQSGTCQQCINGVRKPEIAEKTANAWGIVQSFATVSLTVHPDDVESLKGLLMAYLLPYASVVSIGHVWAMDKPRHGYVYDVKCPIDNVKELSDTARGLYARRVTDVEQVRDRILGGVLQEVDAPRVETVDDIRG